MSIYIVLDLLKVIQLPISYQHQATVSTMQPSQLLTRDSPHESLDSTLQEFRNPVLSPLGDFAALPFDIRAVIWDFLMPQPPPIPEARRSPSKETSTRLAPQTGSSGLQTIQESSSEVSQKPGCTCPHKSNLAILQTSKALSEEILHQLHSSKTISLQLHADHTDVDVLNKELKFKALECAVYSRVDWKRFKGIEVKVLPPRQRSEFPAQVLQLRRLMQLFVKRLHTAAELPVITVRVYDSEDDDWAVDGAARCSFQITDRTTGHKMSDLDIILSPLRQFYGRPHRLWISLPEYDFDWRESVVLGLSVPDVPGKWERTSSQSMVFVPTVDIDWRCLQKKAAMIRSNEALDVILDLALLKLRGKRARDLRACQPARCTCDTCLMQQGMIPGDPDMMTPYVQFSRIDNCASPRLRLHTLSQNLEWGTYGFPACMPSNDRRYARACALNRFSRLKITPEEEAKVRSRLESTG